MNREIVEWTVHSIIDTVPPAFLGQAGPCGEGVEVVFDEPTKEFLGIAAVELLEVSNAEPTFNPTPAGLPASRVTLRLEPIDPYQDMIYQVRVTDLAGNQTTVQDTIGGFTVAAIDPSTGEQVSTRFSLEWKTDSLDYLGRRCDSILLTNYGTQTVDISRATLQGNLEFSIPPSQFPMQLVPGESAMIAICLEGRFAGNQLDTLLIIDSCGRIDQIPLKTPVDFGLGHGVDRCGQNVTIQAFAPSKRTLLMPPFPNPTPGEPVGLDIGLQQDEVVTIEVLNMGGESMLRVLNKSFLTGGLHRLQFEPVGLESGTYFCRMRTERGEVKTVKMVVEK